MNKTKLLRKIIDSPSIRKILKPFMTIKWKIDLILFSFSKDSKFIKSFHNSHEGDRCFIIGNGPSLSAKDLDLIKNEYSFACNKIYAIYPKTVWRPTYYFCSDRFLLMEEIRNIKNLKGPTKFIVNRARRYGRKKEDEIHYFMMYGPFEINVAGKVQNGFSEDVSAYVSTTQTTVCNEIEFAIYMGFKEIILLGVDHNYPIMIDKNGKKTVDFTIKDHFDGGGHKHIIESYMNVDACTECYKVCRDYAEKHDIHIYNATRGGKLEVFERRNLESILDKNDTKTC